jgi:hypothetical protein
MQAQGDQRKIGDIRCNDPHPYRSAFDGRGAPY